MKPYLINLINAVILVCFGLWGFFLTAEASATALIPVITGLLLLAVTPWFRKDNKIVAHLSVVLTFVILIGLLMPLIGAIGRCDRGSVLRVSVMIISSLVAMVFFVKSFIDARRRK